MTIFLMVLKKLIKEQLSPLSIGLDKKAKSVGYNTDLSTDQKEVIDKLEADILRFEGSGNDETDAAKFGELIDKAREKIQIIREKYGESRDEGDTITCLNKLKLHTNDFHKKLESFKFSLLNKEYSETPENVCYYHATYYFGEEIFAPKKGLDIKIREQKEAKLEKRLQSLSELIKPTHTLDEQRERSIQVLDDLASDNKLAIKKDEAPVTVPGMSFWGVSLTLSGVTDYFSASEGRMGVQFNLAARKIRDMSEDKFEPPVVSQIENQM
ncbi:hypothetical protein TUM19329_34010 [Legionella antarctica]|uniref:Coiled-coil protein n=1 Tax=Legionella antarctica TaxID=2708020 RepID=A0A6F8TA50_9GAMM|nr:hypothetical protein [Legionella antarctica]BCA97040.1 hypothetical protein TUM19329_34010 [Legionella antarctica]